MNWKWILLIITALLLPQSANAITYSFTDYIIMVTIDERDNLHEEVSFTIQNLGDSAISWVEYSLISAPQNLQVKDEEGPLLYSVEKERNVLIKLRKPLQGDESKRITLKFAVSGVVTRFEENRILTFSYIPEADITDFVLSIKLPPKSTLASEVRKKGESVSAVYPSPSRIYSDGERIIVEWATGALTAQESFRIFLMYTPIEKKGKDYLIGAFLGILLGFIGAYLYFTRRGEKRKIARMVLRDDEQRIYDMLLSAGGEILQEDIVKNTTYSKVKVSKLVRNLEEKGIIKKEPYRKTNRLLLRKEFGGRF